MTVAGGLATEVVSVPAGPTDELGGMRLTEDSRGFEFDQGGAATPIIRDRAPSNMGYIYIAL